jgi:hypothetical protein
VIYRPETERWSHYFHARLAEQFDAMIHLDETRALQPLDADSGWERGELPDTFPALYSVDVFSSRASRRRLA